MTDRSTGRAAFTLLELILAASLSLVIILIVALLGQSARRTARFVQDRQQQDRLSRAQMIHVLRQELWRAAVPFNLSNEVQQVFTFSREDEWTWDLRWHSVQNAGPAMQTLRSAKDADLVLWTEFSPGNARTNAVLRESARVRVFVEGREVPQWPLTADEAASARLPNRIELEIGDADPPDRVQVLCPGGLVRRPSPREGTSDPAGDL